MGAAMREAILVAACRAIVERGVERVRMQDIAAAAGVSPTLPHYYFKTRSELLRQAFVHAEEGMVRLEREVAGEGPPRERLERLLLVYFDADPRVYEIWMLSREMTTRAIREPGLRDSHEDVYVYWSNTIADVIRAVEGPLASVRGGPPEQAEYGGASEALLRVWIAVRANLRSVVERVTVADVASGKLPRAIDRLAEDPEAWVTR